MNVPILFLLAIAPLLVVALALLWVVRFARRRTRSLTFDEAAYPGLVRLRSATLRSRWLGLALGAVTLIAVFPLGSMGQLALVGPPLAGMVAIGAILVGQRSVQGAARLPGSAGIERRRPFDYLPRGLARSVVVALVALAAAAMLTSAVASPDTAGVPGRAVSGTWVELVRENGVAVQVPHTDLRSPFPGAFYTVPMALAVLGLLIVGIIALVAIAARPRNGADPELVRVDDALRRITAEGVVAAMGLAVGLDLTFLASLAYQQFGQIPQVVSYLVACYGLAIVALAALVYSLRCFALVVIPGNGES